MSSPKAILVGKKYAHADIEEVRKACEGVTISWITSATEEKKPYFRISIPNPKAALADAKETKLILKKMKTERTLGNDGEFHY